MDRSVVYFADLRTTPKRSLFDKIDALLAGVGAGERFRKGHLVAVKLHFGEKGNASYIRPVFVRRVVEGSRQQGPCRSLRTRTPFMPGLGPTRSSI